MGNKTPILGSNDLAILKLLKNGSLHRVKIAERLGIVEKAIHTSMTRLILYKLIEINEEETKYGHRYIISINNKGLKIVEAFS